MQAIEFQNFAIANARHHYSNRYHNIAKQWLAQSIANQNTDLVLYIAQLVHYIGPRLRFIPNYADRKRQALCIVYTFLQ